MFLIVGLGNPEDCYAGTRHNIGFDAINALADRMGIDVREKKHKAFYGKGVLGGQKVILAKPQTFMNNSGESLKAFVSYYKLDPSSDILVLYDDISLDVGRIRIRKKGSAGGHNGIKSIIAHLNTQDFYRIKIGIGEKPPRMDLADYVLGHFDGEDRAVLDETLSEVADAIERIVAGDIDGTMNDYNGRKDK